MIERWSSPPSHNERSSPLLVSPSLYQGAHRKLSCLLYLCNMAQVAHLIRRYHATQKTFLLGNWEGDWHLRGGEGLETPAVPARVVRFTRLLSEMQRAVDQAKADHAALLAAGGGGMRVWCYAEVNRVKQSMADPSYASFVTAVLPRIDPPIDLVSFSNWELEERRELSADELGPELHAALDFIAAHVPPKASVPQPRVFIGEVRGEARTGVKRTRSGTHRRRVPQPSP